jgi:hypothetical protein
VLVWIVLVLGFVSYGVAQALLVKKKKESAVAGK